MNANLCVLQQTVICKLLSCSIPDSGCGVPAKGALGSYWSSVEGGAGSDWWTDSDELPAAARRAAPGRTVAACTAQSPRGQHFNQNKIIEKKQQTKKNK